MSLLNQGYQYLTEQRYDEMDPILEILRTNIVDLGLPLRSIEVEFGPSQVEFTFRTATGLAPADAMVLFRSATKQVAQRHGYHATFMCRPKLAQRHVERLAPAPVADRQEEPRQRLHGRTRTAVGDGQALHGGPARPCARRRPPSARRP